MNIVGDMEGWMLDERGNGMRHMDENCALNFKCKKGWMKEEI